MKIQKVWSLAALSAMAFLNACGSSSPGPAPESTARYALANGCYALRSMANNHDVQRQGQSYAATADALADAEPFYLKPSALGQYLLFAQDSSFLAGNPGAPLSALVTTATAAGDNSNWTVNTDSTGAFNLWLSTANMSLATATGSGDLIIANGTAGAGRFSFEATTGCTAFPEAEVDSTGDPFKGRGVNKPVVGFADSHVHVTATDFLGHAHGGRPFSPWGVTQALGSCSDRHGKNGEMDVIGNFETTGKPFVKHDTTGWPTFKDWPTHQSVTHEQTYYKWLERAWRGGERILVNFLVENGTLCSLNAPLHGWKLDCNEMDSVRLQVQQIHDLQDYIDAQEGGPGKGWFRIVTSPAAARKVINDGKLAVILGIEVSDLFDCGIKNYIAQCDQATIDSELDEFYSLGVRTVFPMHEFDNAYGGNGIFMSLIDLGNLINTDHFWKTYDCPDEPYLYTAGTPLPTLTRATSDTDPLAWARGAVERSPAVATSSSGNQCNSRWMTDLGTYLIQRLMAKKMMIEIDHMELGMKGQAIALAEAQTPLYPVMSSHGGHGGISMDQAQRILNVGGLIFPYKGNGEDYANFLPRVTPMQNPKYYFGVGFGADTNGMAPQAGPRSDNKPVSYPFTLFQGPDWSDPQFAGFAPVTFDQQRTGQRVFSTDVDGFAHYGMMPDFVEEVRIEGGAPAINTLFHSAEAYLEMWERVENR